MLISPNNDIKAKAAPAAPKKTAKPDGPRETFVASGREGGEFNLKKAIAYGVVGGAGGAVPLLGGVVTGLGATLAAEAATNDESQVAKKVALVGGTGTGLLMSCLATAAYASGDWRGLIAMGAANAALFFYAGGKLPSDG